MPTNLEKAEFENICRRPFRKHEELSRALGYIRVSVGGIRRTKERGFNLKVCQGMASAVPHRCEN
jgi:hypothetical protein